MNSLYYLACTIASWVMEIIAVFAAPFLAGLSVWQRADHLPLWLEWFDTLDNALDGDEGIWPSMKTGAWNWKRWLRRTNWLLRNRAYGFSQTVLAKEVTQDMSVEVHGNPKIGNRDGVSGWFICIIRKPNGNLHAWCWMWVRQWGDSGRCVRTYFGWKIKQDAEAGQVRNVAKRMHACYAWPFAGFDNTKKEDAGK